MASRKRRFLEFLEYRHKAIDLPLEAMEYQFIEQFFNYLLVQKKVLENTAMKYAQILKEIMGRAVSKGWVVSNVFTLFKCRYTDPHHDWLTMQEMERLQGHIFSNEKLNVIRDIFLFCSFTGLSFQEVFTLRSSDIITGIDGKKWISKNRQKTDGDETLPLVTITIPAPGKNIRIILFA